MPTAVASLMWVNIARGSTALCLSSVMLDTLLSPVVIPLTMKLLVGSVVELDTWGMVRDLLVMVAVPAVAAMTCYQLTGGAAAVTLKPRLAPFAKLAMLLIIIANATGCAPFLRHLTPTLVRVMLVVFCLCLLGFFLGYWAGRLLRWDFPTIETVAINSGMRNLSAGAVLAQAYFPGDVLFPVAFSPVFLQATTAFIVKGAAGHQARPGGSGRLGGAAGGERGSKVNEPRSGCPADSRSFCLRPPGRTASTDFPRLFGTGPVQWRGRQGGGPMDRPERRVLWLPGGGDPPQSHAAPADL